MDHSRRSSNTSLTSPTASEKAKGDEPDNEVGNLEGMEVTQEKDTQSQIGDHDPVESNTDMEETNMEARSVSPEKTKTSPWYKAARSKIKKATDKFTQIFDKNSKRTPGVVYRYKDPETGELTVPRRDPKPKGESTFDTERVKITNRILGIMQFPVGMSSEKDVVNLIKYGISAGQVQIDANLARQGHSHKLEDSKLSYGGVAACLYLRNIVNSHLTPEAITQYEKRKEEIFENRKEQLSGAETKLDTPSALSQPETESIASGADIEDTTEMATPEILDDAPELQSSPEEDQPLPVTPTVVSTELLPDLNLSLTDDLLQEVIEAGKTEEAKVVVDPDSTPDTALAVNDALKAVAVNDSQTYTETTDELSSFIMELENTQATTEEKESFKKKSFLATLLGSLYGKMCKLYSAFVTLKLKFVIAVSSDKSKINLAPYLEKLSESAIKMAKGFKGSLEEQMEEYNKMYDEYQELGEDSEEDNNTKALMAAKMIHKLADIAKSTGDLSKGIDESLATFSGQDGLDMEKFHKACDYATYSLCSLATIKTSIGFHSISISQQLEKAQKPAEELVEDLLREENTPTAVPEYAKSDNKPLENVIDAINATA